MTEVNGLRLAYRGFIAGLAGGYAWAAIAMAVSALATGDPLFALRPMAAAIIGSADGDALAFVLGFAAIQLGGAVIGMLFAYFFARFFTVRATLTVAAPVVALLAWGLIAAAFTREADGAALAGHAVPVLATLGYGVLLAAGVPVRSEVTRYSGSPST
ncbi:MAG: hypothetical protein IT341_09910 [Chloroflexi bacterium]|nr:hypothetical protein [Chloroflexota bacterium]